MTKNTKSFQIALISLKFLRVTPYWGSLSACFCCEMIELSVVLICLTYVFVLTERLFSLSRYTKSKFTLFLLSLRKVPLFCNLVTSLNVLPYMERYVFLNISETIRIVYLKLGQMLGYDYIYIIGISYGLFMD